MDLVVPIDFFGLLIFLQIQRTQISEMRLLVIFQ